jgi:hypothetical protein
MGYKNIKNIATIVVVKKYPLFASSCFDRASITLA